MTDGGFCVGGRLLAVLDARTGRERWEQDSEDTFWGAPTVAGGRVHAGRPAELSCVEADSGAPR
ncbi:PQQ-binding-like beta-propeller repeat protein [Streptomyces cavernae]|uniref:outer membrane protein assembly factor BamB family protein n=1 Tax=Streptomyces cavernae TaxID=2259034 RepID=UPI0013920C3B|nr:PQQ-binding-like beta-propeller repeat protein [Streptomyces cavernae]